MSVSNFCRRCGARIKDDTREVRLVRIISCKHEGTFPNNQYPLNVADEFCPNCYALNGAGRGNCPMCGRECEIWW
jgi:ribosomal protein L40E